MEKILFSGFICSFKFLNLYCHEKLKHLGEKKKFSLDSVGPWLFYALSGATKIKIKAAVLWIVKWYLSVGSNVLSDRTCVLFFGLYGINEMKSTLQSSLQSTLDSAFVFYYKFYLQMTLRIR